MWGPLEDPEFVAFYEDSHRMEGPVRFRQDWQPMVRAIRLMLSRDYAPWLWASTSHHLLSLTTNWSRSERGHPMNQISWSPDEHDFELVYWSLEHRRGKPPARRCEERQFASVIDSMVQRLLMEGPLPKL